MTPKSTESQHLRKSVFGDTSCTKCLILESQTSRSKPRNHKREKRPANAHNKKHMFVANVATNSQNAVLKSTQHRQKCKPLVLRSPHGSLGGYPRCSSGRDKSAKCHVWPTKIDNARSPNRQRTSTNFGRKFQNAATKRESQSKGAGGRGRSP